MRGSPGLGVAGLGPGCGVLGGGGRKYSRVITPSIIGSNLITTDPGLEANYTSGKCDTLTKSGSPTLAQSSDVHGGAKAQQFQASAINDRVNTSNLNLATNGYYRGSVWCKRLSGSGGTAKVRILNTINNFYGQTPITNSDYYQYVVSTLCLVGTNIVLYPAIDTGSSNYDQVVVDDLEVYKLSLSTCFGPKIFRTPTGNIRLRTRLSPVNGNPIGAWINVDDPSNPLNAVIVQIDGNQIELYKLVNGTYSRVYQSALAWVDGDELGVDKSETNYILYRNGAKIGTTQTISDATIINNTNHLQFSTHPGGVFSSFFIVSIDVQPIVKFTIIGDSIAVAPDRWPYYVGAGFNYGFTELTYHSVSGAHIVENNDGLNDLGTQVAEASSDTPHLILLEIGTNDVDEVAVQTEMLAQLNILKSDHPAATIYVLNIFDRTVDNGVAGKRIKIAAACDAAVVTCWDTTGWIDPTTDTDDGLHLNVTGRIKAANQVIVRLNAIYG